MPEDASAAATLAYQPRTLPRSQFLEVRGLQMHLTHWGPAGGPLAPRVALHGWLDVGGTFQFLVDALPPGRSVIALDWRGFGRSEWPREGYWFPDYVADLDALLAQLSPDAPVDLIGHSMGGNIAALYAGLRPERVRSLVNLEGFGMPRTTASEAPARLRRWLEEMRAPAPQRAYDSFEQLALAIRRQHPRITAAAADYIARLWGTLESSGRVCLAADPRHRWVNPVLYKREDAEAVWAQIRAPLLLVAGAESAHLSRLGADGTAAAIGAAFPGARFESVADAGHMLHIEASEPVAALAEQFWSTLA